MRRLCLFVTCISILFVSAPISARTINKELLDARSLRLRSVLPPGATLAAGDASKNEFYIIGHSTKSLESPKPNPSIQPVQAMAAINEPFHDAIQSPSKKTIKTLAKHSTITKHKIAAKSIKARQVLAKRSVKTHKIVAKRAVSGSKLAIKKKSQLTVAMVN